jgi:hypothetical protein
VKKQILSVLIGLVLLSTSACAALDQYDIPDFDIEHKGVKVKHDKETGLCADAKTVGYGKGCIKLKKKDEKKAE